MSKVFTIAEGLQNMGALKTGGQGSVYKGMRMGPIYSAIKLIPTPIFVEDESDKNYRNFLNEVTKLQQVNEHPSPNVVKILSSGITESGSFPYIEMEYIEGPELSELLVPPHKKVFSIKELLKVAEQLASALAHCHQIGVKHGDIKSNNVKYNVHTGNYVLLDFGLAIMSEEQRRTSIRHAGAIEFMAPEQHEGKMLLQTDVYSYGIILYELLTGQVPFPLSGDGDTGRNSVMIGHLEKEVPNALEIRQNNLENDELPSEIEVPKWLLNIIERCLQKNPDERFANGMELHNAVINGLLSANTDEFRKQNHSLKAEPVQLAALAKEIREKNEALEKELKLLRPLALHAKNIRTTKMAIAGLSVACLVLLAFLVFRKPVVQQQVVAASTTPIVPYEPLFVTYSKQYHQRVMKEREDSIRRANIRAEKLRAATEDEQLKDKKKNRKKFLGIF